MPPELQKHIRYPQGMLSVQAKMYSAYHMQDPQVFYNKEDLWSIPSRPVQGGEQEMEPYYTILKFPGDPKEEFIVMIPFTPSNRDNMSASMAARCDAPSYGKVIVYVFPKQTLVYGPRQIEGQDRSGHRNIETAVALESAGLSGNPRESSGDPG